MSKKSEVVKDSKEIQINHRNTSGYKSLVCSKRVIIISLYMQQVVMDTNMPGKPISVCCYLCGREFGTKGFTFHHKECLVKFTNQQHNKAIAQKIKLPEAPPELQSILKGSYSQASLKKYNEEAKRIFKYKVLPSCKYCQRTFIAQSLAVHIKGCSKKPLIPQQKQNQIEGAIKVPRCLVCCVCGQRFGTSSLRIHYPQCTKKFNNQQFRKHKREVDRKKAPQFSPEDLSLLAKGEWTDAQIQSFNERATQNYRDKGMAECDNCGRKFFFQQMAKHRKNCELINGKINLGKKLTESAPLKPIAKPKTIICVVCGREYGPSSISIHSTQCEELFAKQQKLKTKEERKPMPCLSEADKAEFDLKEVEKWSAHKMERYNKMAFQAYNSKSLSKCYVCLRTFFEQSLPKHLKDCQSKLKDVKKLEKFRKEVKSKKDFFGDNFIQNVIEINKQLYKSQSKDIRKPKMLMCLLCGRQYGASSLKIHLPQCRGQGKAKKENLQKVLAHIKCRFDINQAEKWSQEQLEQYNKQVFQLYKREALHECKYCQRTFFQESLSKHIKHCQLENKKRPQLRRCKTTYETIVQEKKEKEEQKKSVNSNHEEQTKRQEEATQHQESESKEESIEMDISAQYPSQKANGFIKCDLFTSIQFVIPEVEGEDSPSLIKRPKHEEHEEQGQKLMQIPSLKLIEIDDDF